MSYYIKSGCVGVVVKNYISTHAQAHARGHAVVCADYLTVYTTLPNSYKC